MPNQYTKKKAASPNQVITPVITRTILLDVLQQATKRIVCFRGGAGSGKSYSIAQWLLSILISGKQTKILVLRKTLPALRKSILPIYETLLQDWGLAHLIGTHIQFNQSELFYKFNTNYLQFSSLDDPEKIKSSDWNYIHLEEANEFTYDDFSQLRLRLRSPNHNNRPNQIYLSFNPVSPFTWIKEKLLDDPNERPDVFEVISNYKNNPFLPPDYIKELQKLKTSNPNYYKIYVLAQWGSFENLVYSSGFQIVNDMPDNSDEIIYGLDFGFNHPSVLIEVRIKDNLYYAKELLYQSGLTNSELIGRLHKLIPDKGLEIYADCAEPARIQEIFDAGFNIHPADKAVKAGIDFVKEASPFITSDSLNLIKESKSYSWKKDKDGKLLEDPVKSFDDALDAMRYVCYSHGIRIEPRIRFI